MKAVSCAFGLLGLLGLGLPWPVVAAPRYVVDEVAVSLRAAPEADARVLRLLYSGERVQQVSVDPVSGYARVRLPGEGVEGWVRARYLIDRMPARLQLEDTQYQLAQARQRIQALEEDNLRLRLALANAWRQAQAEAPQPLLEPLDGGAAGLRPEGFDGGSGSGSGAVGAAAGDSAGDGGADGAVAVADPPALDPVVPATSPVDLSGPARRVALEAELRQARDRLQRAHRVQAAAGLVLIAILLLWWWTALHQRRQQRQRAWRELP